MGWLLTISLPGLLLCHFLLCHSILGWAPPWAGLPWFVADDRAILTGRPAGGNHSNRVDSKFQPEQPPLKVILFAQFMSVASHSSFSGKEEMIPETKETKATYTCTHPHTLPGGVPSWLFSSALLFWVLWMCSVSPGHSLISVSLIHHLGDFGNSSDTVCVVCPPFTQLSGCWVFGSHEHLQSHIKPTLLLACSP